MPLYDFKAGLVFGKSRNSSKRFRSKRSAEEFEAKLKAAIAPIVEQFDCDIWTVIDQVYECRYDCIPVPLAAA
jgi:hypothetical protein